MEELIAIVAKLAAQYTSGSSSSVTYEKAQQFMEAVQYCIREYEQEAALYTLPAKGQLSAETAYEQGYALVIRKVKKLRLLHQKLLADGCSYGCRNYEDTVQKGLPQFFLRYDPRFAPQDTVLTLDYPTLCPLENVTGIDAIEQYLCNLSLEQKFMGAFSEEYVCRVLMSSDWNYREQFYNLCRVMLSNVLCCVIAGKSLDAAVEPIHTIRLEKWTEEKDREERIADTKRILSRMMEEKWNGNELLYDYLCGGVDDFLTEPEQGIFTW